MLNIIPVTEEQKKEYRVLEHGENVFHEAISYAKQGEKTFYVQNPDGEDYGLSYTLNMDLLPEDLEYFLKMTDGKDVYPPYLDYDETWTDRICLEFLNNFREACFEAIDEYALVCAKLMLLHTEMDVYFTDRRVAWFLPESGHLHIVPELPWNKDNKEKTTLYVIPGVREMGYFQKDYSYISSMPLFNNLFFWQGLTDLPFEQIKYVEMILYKDFGLGAVLNRIYSYSRMFGTKSWEVFLSPGSSRYPDEMLMRYFNISGRPEDATEKNTLVADNMLPLVSTWYFQQFGQGIEEDVFRKEFRQELDEYVQAVLGDKKVLGILIRGSDYVASKMPGMYHQATVDEMIPVIDRWMEEDGYDLLFLATEDQKAFTKMKDHYGSKLRAISQERFSLDEFKGVTMISELEKVRNKKEEYKGAVEDTTINYIYAVYLLSKCESLIASGLNGGYSMTVALNQGRFRKLYAFTVGINS